MDDNRRAKIRQAQRNDDIRQQRANSITNHATVGLSVSSGFFPKPFAEVQAEVCGNSGTETYVEPALDYTDINYFRKHINESSTYLVSTVFGNPPMSYLYPEFTCSKNLTHTRLFTGMSEYELSNHLGNVLATVKDEPILTPEASLSPSNEVAFTKKPLILTAQDYYPFGMLMPNRSFSLAGSNYRFGFNGKEDDRETGTQDYGFRIYNPQLGKFLSVDPLTKSFPWYTPYQFAGNTPIQAIDLDGAEEYIVTHFYDQDKYTGSTLLYVESKDRVLGQTGVLEVNKPESRRAILDKKYDPATHSNAYFNGNSAIHGKYSEKSDNALINSMNENLSKKYNAPNSAKAGVDRIVPGETFIPMEYDKIDVNNVNYIDKKANILKANPDFETNIEGMASPENGTGKTNYNQDLSQKRANSVKQGLLDRDVNPNQIGSAKGTGTKRAEAAGVTPTSSETSKSNYRGANSSTEVKRNSKYD